MKAHGDTGGGEDGTCVSEDGATIPDLMARTRHVAGALLLMTAAFILTKTGRDALYFQEKGLYDLPAAYIGIAMLSLPMSAVALGMMCVLGPRRARIVAPLIVLVCLLAYARAAQPGGGSPMTFFFLFVPLAFGVLFALSWLLAAEFLEGAPRDHLRRAYSLLGGASMLGGVVGALVAKSLALRVDPQAFILMGAAALGVSTPTLALAQSRFPLRAMAPSDDRLLPAPIHFRSVLRQRYSMLLLAIGMLASLVGILIEFQFYLAAATSGNAGRQNADFFANFYLALSSAALLLQLYLIPRLQRSLGVYRSLLILPVAMLGGAAALVANASPLTRSLLRITEGGLKSSIHRVNWEQAYLPLSRAGRLVAKILVDGIGKHVAEGLAAALLYLWLRLEVRDQRLEGQGIAWVSYVLLGTTVAWLALTRLLGRTLGAAVSAPAVEDEMRLDIPLPDS